MGCAWQGAAGRCSFAELVLIARSLKRICGGGMPSLRSPICPERRITARLPNGGRLEIAGLRPAEEFAAAAVSRSGGGASGRRAIVSGLPQQAGSTVCPSPPIISRRAAALSLLAAGLTVAACAKRETSLTVTVRDAAT